MAQIWFTSDYHIGHRNIIGLCERPFSDVTEMEQHIVREHNARVAMEDTVYDLGDFAYRCSAEHAAQCLRSLNGRRIMLWGNHDKPMRQALRKGMLDDLLQTGSLRFVGAPEPEQQTALRIEIEGQQIVLAHYAQRSWIGAFRGAWHLFGHSHGNLSPSGKSFDVGVDVHDFRPLSFEEVKFRMDTVDEQFTEE